MPRFAANLRYLFPELPFAERFQAAAGAGFRGVEYQFPYGTPTSELRGYLNDNGLQMVLINAPPGDWEAGERGLACLPGRQDDFKASIETAVAYAVALDCPRVHVMSGVPPAGVSQNRAMEVLIENLDFAARFCWEEGVRVLIEPLNAVDVPGYLISQTVQARALMSVVDHDNLFLQYDLYHGGMNGEDLLAAVTANLEVIDHLQVAGVPGRHEPNTGNVGFQSVFDALDAMGYGGWIGCEYVPLSNTLDGLAWASIYGLGRPFQAVD